LMDTFIVRTILVPCTVVLLGRWNWWPSKLSRIEAQPGGGNAVRDPEPAAPDPEPAAPHPASPGGSAS
jgi:putative drug exporter of the RND superfamily